MIIKYIDRKTGEEKVESPPGEGFLKFLYHNPFGKLALETLVKRKAISSIYGNMMDKPSSKSKIQSFVDQFQIDMSESVKSVQEFTSFNDFFYRKLKPEARPIQEGLVSPGDGRVIAFESVEEINKFFVKGRDFTLKEYLQNDHLAEKFSNSSLILVRLAPDDYHRFHFPCEGQASPPQKIDGKYFSVSPYALAVNFTKVFCENKREYTLVRTPNRGDVLVSPVGATMVGGIIYTYQENDHIAKGDEMGYFKFGGSSVLVLVDKDQVRIDQDLLDNTKRGVETYLKMGEKIGEWA